ncbi:Potassium efflux system KefA protein [Salmonella enterica subsp. enterica serovar Adelaide str. A4-669]|uniref:Potassium efflux system KefA protein n=1 Tax=Salmonella enterica subsp. enterica serovar Adelaide str. A4-669 TaxID=913063 RepID=A0A6C8GEU5_SALET|nr:Potassium efflux system KefA protein [Salmonella enterica subsp. enterica serovar Adelaide str. A4-669]
MFWSILVASPLPVLWATLGYGLQEAWPYPLAVAIGDWPYPLAVAMPSAMA